MKRNEVNECIYSDKQMERQTWRDRQTDRDRQRDRHRDRQT